MRIDPIKPIDAIRSAGLTAVKPAAEGEQSFGKILADAVGEVNHLQKDAEKSAVDLVMGKLQDISQATIAAEKASIALQLTMQIRNKAVDAYQEIMRMQV
jgi:flagellar hook-basal body complex protein FliE